MVGSERVEQAMRRVLMQHRCFGCGGMVQVYHLCPCCLQLVHPGCECVSPVTFVGYRAAGEVREMIQQEEVCYGNETGV